MAEWRVIPGYERYEVNDQGQIRHRKNRRILTPYLGAGKYLRVNLSTPPGHRAPHVRQLVAMAFVPNPHNYAHPVPINGDHTDCRAVNLEWRPGILISPSDLLDLIAEGLTNREIADRLDVDIHVVEDTAAKMNAPCNSARKLTADDVRAIHGKAGAQTMTEIAREYDISLGMVSRILSGERHADLYEELHSRTVLDDD